MVRAGSLRTVSQMSVAASASEPLSKAYITKINAQHRHLQAALATREGQRSWLVDFALGMVATLALFTALLLLIQAVTG